MNPKTKHTIWLVGGETGGHIIPLLAVADILKKEKTIRLTYIGEKHGQEAQLAKQARIPFIAISSGKLRRYISLSSILANSRDIVRFLWGTYRSYRLIQDKRPSLIFSKGGPVALPVALAAYLTKTPLITHESDAVMGVTNRLIGLFAKLILTGFPASNYPARYAKKIVSVGIPLRREFCQRSSHVQTSPKPMVLITGGSQGAVAINEAVEPILPELLSITAVMHITGERSYQRFQAIKSSLPARLADHYGIINFTPDIASYMREATVVVSRASSTMFELASLSKPMILIPLPSAANNHQIKNAEIFVHYDAAIMLVQENLTPSLLYETIMTVLRDKEVRHRLKEGTRNFNSCDAAKRVAEILGTYLK